MKNNIDPSALQEAMKLASSPAGQKLIALLQAQNSDAIEQARQQAAQGNMNQAKNALSDLLKSDQVQKLIREMGNNNG